MMKRPHFFGCLQVLRVAKVDASVPKYGMPRNQRLDVIKESLSGCGQHSNIQPNNVETMVSVLEKCSNFITIINEMCALQPTVPCPPTNCCYTCNTPLVKHHDCVVRVYSTEGVSKAKKITLEG